jgi:chromosome partitioning protein
MGRVIAVANQKGGVGKTTTTVNLSAALALTGQRILIVDLDPQGHATSGMGIPRNGAGPSVYDALINNTPLQSVVVPTQVLGLDLAPGSIHLAGAEVELVSLPSREARLRNALEPVRDVYSAVFIDCPPSLGLLTLNAMVAADELIIPMQCEYYALEGMTHLIDTVALVRRQLNPGLRISGVLLTMFDPRTNLAEQVATEIRRHFSGEVYKTVIPRSVRLAEAPSFGQPAVTYDPASRGAEAYLALAKEVADRVGQPTAVS